MSTPAEPAIPAAPAPANPEPAPAITPQGAFDEQRALATIAAQRAEEARLKAELAEAKKASEELARIKAEQMSDQERKDAELAEAKAKAEAAEQAAQEGRDALRKARLLAELAKAEHQFVDATAAAALITGVEYDDQGNPTNLTDRIDALKSERSFLVAQPAAPTVPQPPAINAGGGQQPSPAPSLTVEEAQAAQQAGMDPAYYAALKELGSAPNQLEAFKQLQEARRKAHGG